MGESERSEIAALRAQVDELQRQLLGLQAMIGSPSPAGGSAPVADEPAPSRRQVLKLAAAGLGGLGIAAGSAAAPAVAITTDGPLTAGAQADGDETTTLLAITGGAGFAQGVLAVTDTAFRSFDPSFTNVGAVTAYGDSLVHYGVAAWGSTVGVLGQSNGAHTAGVSGKAGAGGTGVRGTSVTGSGVSGTGVNGVTGTGTGGNGRGGVFYTQGGAQVRLAPGPHATHPRSGQRGDLYADSSGRLWFCKTGGRTASWHQLA